MSGHNDCRQQPDGQCQNVFFHDNSSIPRMSNFHIFRSGSTTRPQSTATSGPEFCAAVLKLQLFKRACLSRVPPKSGNRSQGHDVPVALRAKGTLDYPPEWLARRQYGVVINIFPLCQNDSSTALAFDGSSGS